MNAIRFLESDHSTVRGLFRRFKATSDRAIQHRRKIAEKAMDELDVHARIEEEIFYPAIERNAGKEEADMLREAYEEHRIINNLIVEISALPADSEAYTAKFKVLMESVLHHVDEEEDEFFPKVAKRMSDEDLKELGGQLATRQQELKSGTPSLLSGIRHAKDFLTRAVGAMTGSDPQTAPIKRSTPSVAKRSATVAKKTKKATASKPRGSAKRSAKAKTTRKIVKTTKTANRTQRKVARKVASKPAPQKRARKR